MRTFYRQVYNIMVVMVSSLLFVGCGTETPVDGFDAKLKTATKALRFTDGTMDITLNELKEAVASFNEEVTFIYELDDNGDSWEVKDWSTGVFYGDCEDYALTFLKYLHDEFGYNADVHLSIVSVNYMAKETYHAIPVIHTTDGDYMVNYGLVEGLDTYLETYTNGYYNELNFN